MSERVVITAGGTRERMDDVRYVGNFSGGRLGHTIAETYLRQTDSSITIIAPNVTMERYGQLNDSRVEHKSFTTADELKEQLLGVAEADVVYHAAAVSDYVPIFHEGKINSDQDELVVHMKRSPKIISELRAHFGYETKLVGFKLLSDATKRDLFLAAAKQMELNQLDYCIANDLRDIDIEKNLEAQKWKRLLGHNALGSYRKVYMMGNHCSDSDDEFGWKTIGDYTRYVGAKIVSIVEDRESIYKDSSIMKVFE